MRTGKNCNCDYIYAAPLQERRIRGAPDLKMENQDLAKWFSSTYGIEIQKHQGAHVVKKSGFQILTNIQQQAQNNKDWTKTIKCASDESNPT